MNARFAKVHIYITILACVAMVSINIYLQAELIDVAIRLIITILVFYIMGQLAGHYIRTKIFPPKVNVPNDSTSALDDMDKGPKIHENMEDGGSAYGDGTSDNEMDEIDDYD